jgi:hypothetical protein
MPGTVTEIHTLRVILGFSRIEPVPRFARSVADDVSL